MLSIISFSECRRDAPLVLFSGCWLQMGSVRCTFVAAVFSSDNYRKKGLIKPLPRVDSR